MESEWLVGRITKLFLICAYLPGGLRGVRSGRLLIAGKTDGWEITEMNELVRVSAEEGKSLRKFRKTEFALDRR